jgi:hypothetical protein
LKITKCFTLKLKNIDIYQSISTPSKPYF